MRRSFSSLAARLLARLALLVVVCAGCGGARPPDLHETFAAIQIEEARIEHALARSPSACDEVSASAVQICALARESDDRDARTRCERAEVRAQMCSPERADHAEDRSPR